MWCSNLTYVFSGTCILFVCQTENIVDHKSPICPFVATQLAQLTWNQCLRGAVLVCLWPFHIQANTSMVSSLFNDTDARIFHWGSIIRLLENLISVIQPECVLNIKLSYQRNNPIIGVNWISACLST
jgi:hypothetical protein